MWGNHFGYDVYGVWLPHFQQGASVCKDWSVQRLRRFPLRYEQIRVMGFVWFCVFGNRFVKFLFFCKFWWRILGNGFVFCFVILVTLEKQNQIWGSGLGLVSCIWNFFFSRKTVFWPLNAMFTIFLHQILHQILSGGLLLVTMGEQKSYLCCRFKLESITTYDLWFVVKILWT